MTKLQKLAVQRIKELSEEAKMFSYQEIKPNDGFKAGTPMNGIAVNLGRISDWAEALQGLSQAP